jgi:hypothetical protein
MNIVALLAVVALTPADRLPSARLPPLAPTVDAVCQLVQLADQASARRASGEVRLPNTPALEAIQLRVVYRVPGVTVEGFRTNEILGAEVPGRRITASVRVDVLVHLTFDVSKMSLRQDPDFTDTCELVLPPPEVTSEFPRGELADYAAEYGWLHVPYFSRDLARDLRTGLYAEARDKAQARFRLEVESALREDMVRELRQALRQHFPGKRVYIRIGS